MNVKVCLQKLCKCAFSLFIKKVLILRYTAPKNNNKKISKFAVNIISLNFIFDAIKVC